MFAAFGWFGLLAILAPQTTLAAPCVPGPATLCLNNQRFQLEVRWKDFQGNTGVGQAVSLTSDTGYFWFFNNSNVELVVKVLDGRGLNGHFWVFFGALSNVEYTLNVTDTTSGNVKTYFNPSGQFASVGDTQAFSASGSAPRSTGEKHPIAAASSTCQGNERSLCLNGGRFRVEVNWKDFAGNTGRGTAVSLTADTGYFWFFNDANVELVVKVLDARALNNRFWVFYGALSNVEYEMTVTDTITGNVNRYSNPSGRFASTGDTEAFRAGYGVVARLDEGRAVSSDIPTTGGTLSATAGDGTVFTLTVPRDALLSEERITMTPVTAVDGLPLSGGLVAAVDLAPTGLRLFQFATLTIAPAASVPRAEEVTFAWRGSGEEFFLYPPALDTPSVSMKLMHFSGYGVGRGSAADQAAQQQRVPASPEDALSQRLQDLVAKRRRTQSIGLLTPFQDESDFAQASEAELRTYYETELKAQLEAAKTNCFVAKATIQRGFAWARSVQLLGLDPKFVGEINNVFDSAIDALVHCYNESYENCVGKKDPDEIREMLAYTRQLALLGADDQIDQDKASRCARFELRYESIIDDLQPYGPAFAWRHETRSVVPDLAWDNDFSGSANLTYTVSYIGQTIPSECTHTSVGAGSTFQVVKISVNLNYYEGQSPPLVVSVEYAPGNPEMTFTMTCKVPPPAAQPPPVVLKEQRWRSSYDFNHSGERSGGGFKAREWIRLNSRSDIYARRSYRFTSQLADETTIIELKHTPQ